jgi:hypothetical protein
VTRAARWLLGAALALLAGAAQAQPLYRWTQYVPGGLEARAITREAQCPQARIDRRAAAMRVRAEPNQAFPVRVCALAIPAGAQTAEIEGEALPLPKARADQILVLGDTGCRVTRLINQSCNDPADWPFAAGAKAEAMAAPDVIVHVGDMLYREKPCRPFNEGCAHSPHGDVWAVWESDFFAPATPLLRAAPLVMVRGNHEMCGRGGKGWSRFLDPYPLVSVSGCLSAGAPFAVDLGGLTLVVMDVATASDGSWRDNQLSRYRAQFESLARLAPHGPIWLAMHRPIRAAAAVAMGFTLGQNRLLAAASKDATPSRVAAILSGHIHTFQALAYEQDLPAQLVSGHSGAELHWTAPDDVKGLVIEGATVASGTGRAGVHGFVTLSREGAGPDVWRIENRDFFGKTLDSCRLTKRKLACGTP